MLVLGIGVVVPPLLRLQKEGWTGPNVFFVVGGILLTCFRLRGYFFCAERIGKNQAESELATRNRSFTRTANWPTKPHMRL